MGDRCYLVLMCRAEDAEKIAEHLGGSVDDETSVVVEEANYALFDEREELADQGYAFYGNHSTGSDYGHHVFAASEGEMIDIPCDYAGINPVIPFYRNYVDDERAILDQVDEATTYWKKVETVERLIQEEAEALCSALESTIGPEDFEESPIGRSLPKVSSF